MRVQPISDALRGERIVAVSPPLAPNADPAWRRRLNLYTGRTLSDAALSAEQTGRAGRLALRGQLVSSGIVSGLEAALETVTDEDGRPLHTIRIAPGLGLAASGEDVSIGQPRRVNVRDIRVVAPVALPEGPPAEPVRLLDPNGPPLVRALGATLGERIAARESLPFAAILLLRPVVAELIGRPQGDDSACDPDPQDDAFEDWQLADGCALTLYAWPTDWLALPPPDARWRNTLAYAVYDADRAMGSRPLPWEAYGVPIGLLAFDPLALAPGSETDLAWTPLFLDRYSVARDGGKPRHRTAVIGNAGNPFLWQARLQQLVEQVADAARDGVPTATLREQLRFLPPAGLLPRDAITTATQQNGFFPSYYTVEAAPVPIEQLDAAIEASAGLMAYDLFAPDHVQVLVPVPQQVYEPNLLLEEEISPVFARAIDEAAARRTRFLQVREYLRTQLAALGKAATGAAPAFPAPADDPGRLEDEGEYRAIPFTPRLARRTRLAAGSHAQELALLPPRPQQSSSTLFTYVYIDPDNPPREIMLEYQVNGEWEHRAFWGADLLGLGAANTASRHFAGPLPAAGQWVRLTIAATALGLSDQMVGGVRFRLFDGRVAWGPSGDILELRHDDVIIRRMANWFDEAQLAAPTFTFENDELTVLRREQLLAPFEDGSGIDWTTADDAPQPRVTAYSQLAGRLMQGIAKGDASKLDTLGVKGLIDVLEQRVARADDAVNFNFLRAQTDIYRARQFMLGNTDGSRLAVSPTLSSIAKGVTATATQEQIQDFFKRINKTPTGTLGGAEADSGVAVNAVRAAVAFESGASTTGVSAARLNLNLGELFGGPSGAVKAATSAGTKARFDTVSEVLKVDTVVAGVKAVDRTPKPIDIIGQLPLIGHVDIRTTTVAERIATSQSTEARDFSLSSKYDVVRTLKKNADPNDPDYLGIDPKEILVPGVVRVNADGSPMLDQRGRPMRETVTLEQLAPERLLREPAPQATDEAGQFLLSVDFLDHSIAVLRQVEGQVARYRAVIDDCKSVLADLQSLMSQVNARMDATGDDLSEARQDVSAARALLADEQARVGAINDRRAQVLEENVQFLAYCRPRVADLLAETPSRSVEAGVYEQPLPACLQGRTAIPDELHELIGLVREAPARWFPAVAALLASIDRVEHLTNLLQHATLRAQVQAVSKFAQPLVVKGGGFAPQLAKVFFAQQQSVAAQRVKLARFDMASLVNLGWQSARDEAAGLVSIGDLIDNPGGRSDVGRRASEELDRIGRVAACLHAEFAQVRPAIRLDWAERLGQYDGPVNLRNLASLPRWNEIEREDRRQMQSLADWLFGRVLANDADAVALMNDLVRVCVLLASHAPVNRIVAGALARETALTADRRVDITVFDTERVRVGMYVRLFQNEQVVAHGRVEDLKGGLAATRIERLVGAARTAASFTLAAGARVQFSDTR